MDNRVGVSQDYQEFVTVAQELTDQDVKRSPPGSVDVGNVFEKHFRGMVELYTLRYGSVVASGEEEVRNRMMSGAKVGSQRRSKNVQLALLLLVLVAVSGIVGYVLCLALKVGL